MANLGNVQPPPYQALEPSRAEDELLPLVGTMGHGMAGILLNGYQQQRQALSQQAIHFQNIQNMIALQNLALNRDNMRITEANHAYEVLSKADPGTATSMLNNPALHNILEGMNLPEMEAGSNLRLMGNVMAGAGRANINLPQPLMDARLGPGATQGENPFIAAARIRASADMARNGDSTTLRMPIGAAGPDNGFSPPIATLKGPAAQQKMQELQAAAGAQQPAQAAGHATDARVSAAAAALANSTDPGTRRAWADIANDYRQNGMKFNAQPSSDGRTVIFKTSSRPQGYIAPVGGQRPASTPLTGQTMSDVIPGP